MQKQLVKSQDEFDSVTQQRDEAKAELEQLQSSLQDVPQSPRVVPGDRKCVEPPCRSLSERAAAAGKSRSSLKSLLERQG